MTDNPKSPIGESFRSTTMPQDARLWHARQFLVCVGSNPNDPKEFSRFNDLICNAVDVFVNLVSNVDTTRDIRKQCQDQLEFLAAETGISNAAKGHLIAMAAAECGVYYQLVEQFPHPSAGSLFNAPDEWEQNLRCLEHVLAEQFKKRSNNPMAALDENSKTYRALKAANEGLENHH